MKTEECKITVKIEENATQVDNPVYSTVTTHWVLDEPLPRKEPSHARKYFNFIASKV